MDNDRLSIASKFINTTSSHLFLTGKAGTGKTTFLKNLKNTTHKTFIVVAPTGIAALNAGGVTIHSQFLFPIGTFIPERSLPQHFAYQGSYFSQEVLARKHPLNSARKQVLRSIDLLVIDEVSMLRADLLDAIDYRLKSARGNFEQSFGGVQLLLIGDLYQLPPVINREEVRVLSDYYPSPWFYESKALKRDEFIYIELDKIFRQTDEQFIALLNKLRDNRISAEEVQMLNAHYRTEAEIKELKEIITLTTHNNKADAINKQALMKLASAAHFFEAKIQGDFPEQMFPVLQSLELKVGSQIMFVKNDTEEKMYFNGKLATVTHINNDGVEVRMAESGGLYQLKKTRWENKKYHIDAESKSLHEEVAGTFEQYPVKLAWAITVHKSQGLTFDKAIIDVGQAFADGQVYVALSRLRSLDGLILRTRISPDVISTDEDILRFSKNHHHPQALPGMMEDRQRKFLRQLLHGAFDFTALIKEFDYVNKYNEEANGFDETTMQSALKRIRASLQSEKDNTHKFHKQLESLMQSNQTAILIDRVEKGSAYYKNMLWQNVRLLLTHIAETKKRKRVKAYLNQLSDLEQLLAKKLSDIYKAAYITEHIIKGDLNFDFSGIDAERAKQRSEILAEIDKQTGGSVVKPKSSRGKKLKRNQEDGLSTYDVTLQLIRKGLTVQEVAEQRGLVPGTIDGHLAKAVAEDRISIFEYMDQEDVNIITSAIQEMTEEFSIKDLFEKMKGKYTYGQLRSVIAHVKLSKQKTTD